MNYLKDKDENNVYEGKFFYEVVKPKSGGIQLFGPFDNIYFAASTKNSLGEEPTKPYKYVQIVDGLPVQAFFEEEILVTDRKL